MKRAYLDHNATTPVRPEVAEVVGRALAEWGGNPSSGYRSGREARRKLDEARDAVASLFRVDPAGVIFTGSGTEADNLALLGGARKSGKRGIVISEVEHPAIEEPARLLESEGFGLTRIPVDGEGVVDPARFNEAIDGDTAMVSLIHGQNETGVLQPVAEVGRFCRERGVPFHTDAAQTAGKLPIDLASDPIDMVTVVGHKIYGPKGIGALIVRDPDLLQPILVGGGQEGGKRPGTESVALALGLATALELAAAEGESEKARLQSMRDRFEAELLGRVDRVHPVGARLARIPGTSYLLFEGVSGGEIAARLDEEGLEVSTGSACHTGSPEPSAVLTAMGIERDLALGGIRVGFGKGNSDDDADRLVAALAALVPALRDKE